MVSVIETFVHDPICDWTRNKHVVNTNTENAQAKEALAVIAGGHSLSVTLALNLYSRCCVDVQSSRSAIYVCCEIYINAPALQVPGALTSRLDQETDCIFIARRISTSIGRKLPA